MLRGLCRQATRRWASYETEALVYSNQRAHDATGTARGSLHGKENTKHVCGTDRKHPSLPHQNPMKRWGNGNTRHLARLVSLLSDTRASPVEALVGPSFIRHYGIVQPTQKRSSFLCRPCVHYAGLKSTVVERSVQAQSIHGSLYVRSTSVSGLAACLKSHRAYSSSVGVKEQTNVGKEHTDENDSSIGQKLFSEVEEQTSKGKKETNGEDVFSQMLEMMGFLVDGDLSAAATELRQAQQKMLAHMKRCSRVLFAVGAVHLTWGGMMFFALDSPLNHAVLTEVCMSSLVICGLAYQIKQTMKPIEFFANQEEHRRMRIIFLSRQVSRMLGAFFTRGYGIAFVLSLTLMAHSLSCVRFLL